MAVGVDASVAGFSKSFIGRFDDASGGAARSNVSNRATKLIVANRSSSLVAGDATVQHPECELSTVGLDI